LNITNFSSWQLKLGIHTQQVKTHENSAYSPFVPLDDKLKR
jgi:protease-4